MKRYAVLHAPDFRLQATLRHVSHRLGEPMALVGLGTGRKACVLELNRQARENRVEVGMTPTQATARCAGIRLVPGDAGHERSAQEALLQVAERISPFIESTGAGLITVEWPAARPADEKELEAQIIHPLRAIGLDVRLGISETPFLAMLASQGARPVCLVNDSEEFLAPLPVRALQPSLELATTLEAWGVRTIAQLRVLPRREACERLGPEAVVLWERAEGGSPRPLNLVKPVEVYSERSDLENGIETLEPLLFLLRRFLEQIAIRLEIIYLVVGQLRLGLTFESGSSYHHVFTIPQPTRDVDLLFRMLHTHLENFTSEAPIVAVELLAQPVRSSAEQFGLLERGLKDPHQLAETLARLQALVGHGRVGTPEVESSRHPDAFHLRPFDPGVAFEPENGVPDVGVPWLRFRPPIAAKVVLSEQAPAFLYSSRFTGSVRERRGPWRIAGDWWDRRSWSREEWDIETDDGFYRLVQVEDGWFIDGIYY